MIEQSIAAMQQRYSNNLRQWWELLFSFDSLRPDGFGLFAPTSYVLQIAGTRLLVDPCLRDAAWGDLISDRLQNDLESLDGILLTHEHEDHCDPNFIRLAAGAKVRWFVPDFFRFNRLYEWGLSEEKITRTSNGQEFSLGAVTLRIFESNHRNEGKASFVREYGFSLTHSDQTYVFPGDIRTYDPSFYPKFPDTAILFSHLWLGREQALNPPWEPKLTEFCQFVLSFHPRRITLAHLYETGRPPVDLWTYQHAGAVKDRLLALSPDTEVTVLEPGIWHPF